MDLMNALRHTVGVPRVLLPTAEVDHRLWAVIACDQFTSQPDYWQRVERTVGDASSTLHMVLPELHLHADDVEQRIDACQRSMQRYLDDGLLTEHEAIVYVERTVSDGLRRGLVVELDLEAYDYAPDAPTPVRSTEGTVLDRLPPRMDVRREAVLETPHILVLFDDPTDAVLTPVVEARASLPVAYDVELMEGSGHVTGRLIDDPALQASVLQALASLVGAADEERPPLQFAMGDGNHSLAAAKAVWQELKDAGAGPDHPGRRALVELVNLHDASLSFEPIHRVVFDADGLVDDVLAALGASLTPAETLQAVTDAVAADAPGQRFGLVTREGHAVVEVPDPTHQLTVGTLQAVLDAWLEAHPAATVDYVHGEDVAAALGGRPGNAAFVLPGIGKDAFFASIAVDGPLPRKTFSMGHAHDKRFYLECRRIR